MWIYLLVFLVTWTSCTTSGTSAESTCYTGYGRDYRGKVAKTIAGKNCQSWSAQTPHRHIWEPKVNQNEGLEENYCRNPGGSGMPWCYTTDPETRWEYCLIPKCDEELTCYTGDGRYYRGTVAKTIAGKNCQSWSAQTPHRHIWRPKVNQNEGLEENYCRNPERSEMPWCYTTDPETRWEYCPIPKCDEGFLALPVISLIGIKGDLLSWRCNSGCWFPEPEMSWLDSDGNNITAEPSVTEQPSDRCYVVQRTVTVAKTVNVACRVHLPHFFTHTVETHGIPAGVVAQPVISLIGIKGDLLSWRCNSGCWFPEPEMSWLDSDGNNITAEPSVTEQPSDRCYVVQRTVTVDLTVNVTCRVHLPHFNHTVETHGIPAEKKKEGGTTVRAIAGIVLTVIIIIVAMAILGNLCWKMHKKTKPSGLNEMIMVQISGEEEQLKDDSIPSPKPRKWLPVSKKWRPQFEKFINTDDCNVTKVGSYVFGKVLEFRISKGSGGDEVFLGLRDDGTEVAVKRTTLYNYDMLKKEQDLLRLPFLDDPSIVRYVDFIEDNNFVYLVLQLCEYNLAEYITKHDPIELERKQLAEQVLTSLSTLHSHKPPILHRDIKPQNVLIDIRGRAKFADFGISRLLPDGQTALITKASGTSCWMAKETLEAESDIPYKRSTDIQVSGMLIYYILSRGEHPFGKYPRCDGNIVDGIYNLDHVPDVLAKDLIEWMINEDPTKRPTVEESLAHPFFWTNERKVEYLRRIGNLENRPDADKDLVRELDQHAVQVQINSWKDNFPPEMVQKMDGEKESYPENSFGLLRFVHDLHEHHAEDVAHIDLLEMFPDLFGEVYLFAKEQGWNSRPSLKDIFTAERAVKTTNPGRNPSLN